ncbi:predicted protein [Sclerotinia sclerotiorum 1980 UF-70]|uniref:Uncharacterized protein n=1 Tax=Sclerotinia sclerotiorum (strain ATCC 18683 / 1980 / Ss-1) TaxID=665079 RepID=A7EVU8_SCLS1|nr:predicted protein [Sclerotinia sclerotiorum 1980 UF-70]EDN93590.1 predicted protein [Sclerotinia sclerotiorum 1980 UF-70]
MLKANLKGLKNIKLLKNGKTQDTGSLAINYHGLLADTKTHIEICLGLQLTNLLVVGEAGLCRYKLKSRDTCIYFEEGSGEYGMWKEAFEACRHSLVVSESGSYHQPIVSKMSVEPIKRC